MKTYKLRSCDPCGAMFRTISKVVNEKDSKGKNVKKTVVRRVLNVPLNPDGSFKQLPIDQFNGKSFLRNACGWPMNDIMAYEETQNESIARAVLSRISMIKGDSGDGLTDQERFERIVPANYSSPAEFLSISEKFGRLSYAKAMAQQREVSERAAASAAAKVDPSKSVHVEPE